MSTQHMNPIDFVLGEIRKIGSEPTRSGSGWSCRCPAHDDRNPSLSIDVGEDGRVLLHCHAGCTPKSIVSSLGIRMNALFPSDTTPHGCPVNQQSATVTSDKRPTGTRFMSIGYTSREDAIQALISKEGKPDDSWVYNDEKGNSVGLVFRWDQDGGKNIRPISLIDGRWYCKGMPVPRLLYRLDEVLSSSDPVLVCEGEKASEIARDCGFLATTSAHGCKSPQKTDWSPIAGREIILVPDLDEAGEQYAQRVKQLCQLAGAFSIRILDLRQHWPQLGTGDDLADALDIENGDSASVRSGIEALIHSTPTDDEVTSKQAEDTYRPFPIDALPEPLCTYAGDVAQAIGCDPAYIALPMLSMLAGAIGNTYEIEVKNTWREPCVVWSCIVGKSGTVKSPAIELATNPLQMIQNEHMLDHRLQMKEQRLENNADAPPHVPVRQIIDDVTIEAVLQLLQENPRGLLLRRDELSGWFDFDRYQSGKGGNNAARWVEMFHGRPVSVDRRTKGPIFVARASLSITGSIQPGILRGVMNQNNLDNGLAARFLLAMPPHRPKRWSDCDLHPKTAQAMHALVQRLSAIPIRTSGDNASVDNPKPHVLRFNHDAKALLILFVNDFNVAMTNEDEHIASAWSKLEAYTPRFAMLMHLVRMNSNDDTISDPAEVDAESISIAIRLVEWFKHESKRVYAMITMSKEMQQHQSLIEWIINKGGSTTVRELSRGPSKYKASCNAKIVLEELVKAGHGFWRGRPPNGRTIEFVLKNHTQGESAAHETSDSDSTSPNTSKNHRDVTGASVRSPVPSIRKDN